MDDAQSLLRPLRARILHALAGPASASGVARVLSVPRQKVNYHLRELERQGMVELVEERKKGNCVERIVRATSRAYLVSAEAMGALPSAPEVAKEAFSAGYLVAVAAEAIRDVAALRERAEKANKRLPTFTLQTDVRFATAKDRHAFVEELANAVGRLVARYHDEEAKGGRAFRLFAGMHPATHPEKKKETP